MATKNKRPWRKVVKKLQRKRRRQKLAKERDLKIEQEELEKLKDPAYQEWLMGQEEIAEMKRQTEEKEHKELEAMWLLREQLAQKQFQKDEEQRLVQQRVEQQILEFRLKRLKEQEEAAKRQREEIEKKAEEATKYLAEIAYLCQEYVENPGMKTPEKLNVMTESRPSEKPCEFYRKTQCCRFEARCGLNHVRPLLSHVILIRNFFQHPLFEHKQHKSSDRKLEFSDEDLKKDYEEFCKDVWPELEQFGKIVNFRTTRNRPPRGGHVFVEYAEKRSALKAFTNLQNRFYAGKQLSVEFSHVTYWRSALCGLALGHKCNKGDKCNYLHIFANPENKYNTKLEKIGKPKKDKEVPKGDNFGNDTNSSTRRNWRWSESPELEMPSTSSQKENETNNVKSPIVIISSSEDEEDDKTKNKTKSSPQIETKSHQSRSKCKQKSPKQKDVDNGQKQIAKSKRKKDIQSTNDMIMISSTSEDDSDIILIKTPQRKSRDEKSAYKHKHHKRKSSHDSSSRSRSSSSHRS
ncbi:U2 small nuclear ribonucleoprotein auxiliary factor 35 kDa subunit-related protein 1 [Musca vetustissima]|uniref:U2 small nuclear ribonucleoprotein auxiliary factor 35 kDa subunit-related protein 1 n=1 Tax=Musca vetustissima TaxID=27455 RepID=UPI002AB69590|nr:U2 small nuclear ribonucleoprotein auxiliary factor 35 kDa subunit-related protein 1 [Musca vetustissima]